MEDKSRYEQAQWRTRNSYWSYVNTKSSISLSLKDAFSNLMYAQESVTLAQSILERRESNYKLVSVRYENGRENKGSVLLAEAYFEQAQLDVTRSGDGLAVAQTRLKSLMNKDHLDGIDVSGEVPLEKLQFEGKEIPDLAVETPTYNQAMAVEMAAQEDISIARSAFLPSLDLSGNVIRQGQSYFPERERWAVALTLTIPIFDGFRDQGLSKGAVLSKYAAEGKKKSTLLDLLPRLRDAQNLAKQSDLKLNIDDKFRKASGTRAEIARAKYNNGLITFEDWDIIENELIQRQTSYLLSKKDRVVKYATWENLLGRGVIP
jgi:outer membrane protein TolC